MGKKLTYEHVYEQLRNKIASGQWQAGQRLPTLEQLSAEMQVGISSIREAVRILGQQRILRIEQGRGTFVEDTIQTAPQERMDFLEQASFVQLTEARLIIEPELAALAAVHATEAEKHRIRQAAETMKRKIERDEDFLREDLLFHRLIAEASRNEILCKMMERMNDLLLDSRRKTMKWPGMDDKAGMFHMLVALAIEQGNEAQARNLMREHIADMLLVIRKEKG